MRISDWSSDVCSSDLATWTYLRRVSRRDTHIRCAPSKSDTLRAQGALLQERDDRGLGHVFDDPGLAGAVPEDEAQAAGRGFLAPAHAVQPRGRIPAARQEGLWADEPQQEFQTRGVFERGQAKG